MNDSATRVGLPEQAKLRSRRGMREGSRCADCLHASKWQHLLRIMNGNQSQSSLQSASRTRRISFPIAEEPAAVPGYGEDARRRAGTKVRVRGADSSELSD
jgi:hypothetical protein